jgi:redox-sensitive bicupin YhaK (pirin superfamily)
MDKTADIETLVVPRTRDLGDGFLVRRALPSAGRQMVGPFIFFDQMGPAVFSSGRGLDVRPHPHIGLATVTYLFEGEVIHRDSLGSNQRIEPGAVNWMTAGKGIVHSERSAANREGERRLFGVQIWVALPKRFEETEPVFAHFAADRLPISTDRGVKLRMIAGKLGGIHSPVAAHSELFYADVALDQGAVLQMKPEHEERAAYVVEGSLEVGQARLNVGDMPVFSRRSEVSIRASSPSRILIFGGEPMDGPRYVVWNFVSSSRDRIETAKEDWKARRFPGVPNETEFVPFPTRPPGPAVSP